MVQAETLDQQDVDPEGFDQESGSWGDYPIDDMLIRSENRTVYDINRRIEKGSYILNPEFQRDFIWNDDKQSKLIESVIMRIPIPVFYLAENREGKMVVVDGLQRLSTFRRYLKDELKLKLPDRKELDGRKFCDLPTRLQNRVEDINLIFYIIDSKAPERARLDIFERVNSGEPLTRQQMRNSLYMGSATKFLRNEAGTPLFKNATGNSLSWKKMRDREFINRFCAFQILDLTSYRGDMDQFLAECLIKMNDFDDTAFKTLANEFRRSLENNVAVFGKHAFRRHEPNQPHRSVLNASLWDVMSTGLSKCSGETVKRCSGQIREMMFKLFDDEEFMVSITRGTSDARKVRYRFETTRNSFRAILGCPDDNHQSPEISKDW